VKVRRPYLPVAVTGNRLFSKHRHHRKRRSLLGGEYSLQERVFNYHKKASTFMVDVQPATKTVGGKEITTPYYPPCSSCERAGAAFFFRGRKVWCRMSLLGGEAAHLARRVSRRGWLRESNQKATGSCAERFLPPPGARTTLEGGYNDLKAVRRSGSHSPEPVEGKNVPGLSMCYGGLASFATHLPPLSQGESTTISLSS